ncbi:MAG: hypothetical protein RI911_673 [Candidatus Parcubacteria bacterium]
MDIHLIIGCIGAGMILVAFIALQLHYINDEDVRYDIANTLGSVCLVWYAYSGSSWPFFILNTVWGLISLRDVILYYTRRSS